MLLREVDEFSMNLVSLVRLMIFSSDELCFKGENSSHMISLFVLFK